MGIMTDKMVKVEKEVEQEEEGGEKWGGIKRREEK